ncbi:MAG: hypothetical protein DHS20C08_13180 [Rhodomicrobium sp.]|nr:MAG: hypothetical protein DHS20C08_13180 [Rhodomicrobium sp.]
MNKMIEANQEAVENFGKGLSHFNHNFAESGLFTDEKLAQLIERYPREYYMINTMTAQGDKPEWRSGEINNVSGEKVLQALTEGRIWLALRRFDVVCPEYDELVHEAFREMEELQPGLKTFKHNSSMLISSPGARVLYHADIPYVCLFHVRGRKKLWLYDAENKEHLPDRTLEGVILKETEEEIGYEENWDKEASEIVLEPGKALSWQLNAPHRVDNLDGLNVSITTDYFTPYAQKKYGVYYTNGVMRRKFGMSPKSTSTDGLGAYAKCAAALAFKKSGMMSKDERTMVSTFTLDPENIGQIIDIPQNERREIVQL